MTYATSQKSNSTAPLAAVTLFMVASLFNVGQSMDADPRADIAAASAPATNG